MKADNVDDIYGLSPMQRGVLFHTLYATHAGVYYHQVVYTVRGELNAELFDRAWQRVMKRHAVLRTSFHWEDLDKPVQIVHRDARLPLEQHDWRGLSAEEQETQLQEYVRADRERGVKLDEAPLMRLVVMRIADDLYQIVWSHHHLLMDGWSVPLVLKDVLTQYEALRLGKEVSLPPGRPFRDYINWLKRHDLAQAEAFWRNELKGFTNPTRVGLRVTVKRSAGGPQARYREQRRTLPEAFMNALRAFAREQHLTVSTLLQGAWALLLSRYSGQEDVVFGSTVSGRPPSLPGVESMVGLFINTLPVRVQATPDEPALAWLQRLQDKLAEIRQYEYTPLVDVQGWSEVHRMAALFDSLVVVESYPVDDASQRRSGALTVQDVRHWGQSTYPLTLVAAPRKDLSLRITYEHDRFDQEMVGRMLGQLPTLLEGMMAQPEQRLAELSLLTAVERQEMLETWGGGHIAYPPEHSLAELFEAQAAQNPDAAAVTCQGETLTYAELNQRANRLAHHLQALGVAPEVLVGVCLERSLDLVVALLGVLKAGGAYLPLDPAYPRERLGLLLDDSKVPVLVTRQELIPSLPPHQAQVICLDADAEALARQSAANPAGGARPGNLAYVIYTSGSTGTPKGVQVSHYNVVRLFQATDDWYHFGAQDVWTLFHSFAFDFSVWELWGALLYGGRLVVVPYQTSRDPAAFYALLCSEGVTVLNQTPSAFLQLIQVEALQGVADDLRLRLVIFGGEALELSKLAPWFEQHGDQVPQLVNMYGITETTVHVTYRPLAHAELKTAPGSVIGGPIPDLRVYVLDRNRQPVPVGVPGELYVGGAGVARGYLNRPELTAERFLPDPFDPAGGRLYKSGDLARWLPGGDLEYLGRGDDQVKIRGFRIELGEIEAALGRHPQVRQAVVLALVENPRRAKLTDERHLVAYVVPKDSAAVTPAVLRDFLKDKLPDYMLPSAFVLLDALPLTANGKLDRRALPAPKRDRGEMTEPFVAAQTELEVLLTGLWREILKVDQVGVRDNFFELGGNSLLGVTLISRLQQKLGEIVQVVLLFDAPTISELAEHLRRDYRAAVARLCPTEPLPELPSAERDGALTGAAVTITAREVAEVRELLRPAAGAGAASAPGDGNGVPKNRPAIFVLSPPRSGTTLLRVLLGGHARLFAPPELELLSFATLQDRKAAFAGRDSFWLEGAVRAVMEIRGCDADAAKLVMADFEASGWTTRQLYRQLQEWLGEKLLVDKTPSYALRPEVLRRMEDEFEGARYLHLLRHPQAMIRSFEEARLDQLFFRYPHQFSTRQLAELIWLVSHQNITAFLEGVPAERQLQVRFEDLVRRPGEVVETICRFLGLEFHPAMLRPYEDKKSRMTDGIHPESRMLGDVKFHEYRGIDEGVADRWKTTRPATPLGAVTIAAARSLGYEEAPAAGGGASRSPLAVPIQPAGSRPPFFCVHPLGGEVFSYRHLAKRLGDDQPLYGLQARGLFDDGEPHLDLETMAGDYLREVRAIQPNGPYYVGGWSLGAIVAFEMAQQLRGQGQEVGLLAILDAPLFPYLLQPLGERKMKPSDVTLETSLLRLARRSKRLSLHRLHEYSREEQMNLLFEQARLNNFLPPEITQEKLGRWVAVLQANMKALLGYGPVHSYPGPITVFRATQSDQKLLPEDRTPDLGWAKVSDRVEVQTILGSHNSMVREPMVQILAERLSACIDKALADHGVLSPR
jgi:amino acid adenylation domain-containing protein